MLKSFRIPKKIEVVLGLMALTLASVLVAWQVRSAHIVAGPEPETKTVHLRFISPIVAPSAFETILSAPNLRLISRALNMGEVKLLKIESSASSLGDSNLHNPLGAILTTVASVQVSREGYRLGNLPIKIGMEVRLESGFVALRATLIDIIRPSADEP